MRSDESVPHYSASRAAPVVATIFLGLLAATVLVASIVGFLNPVERAAAENAAGLLIRLIAGVILVVGSCALLFAAVRNLPRAFARRFDAGADGIQYSSVDGTFVLLWDDIASIRLVADTRQSLGYRWPLVPRSVNRRATTWLQFTPLDAEELELDQPALESLRLRPGRFTRYDGYTHGLQILAGVFAPSYDIADYAPQLQRVLETYAGGAYAGAKMRNSDSDVG